MSETRQIDTKKAPSKSRILRWIVVGLLAVMALGGLVSWLVQRSLSTPARKRAMQFWLDEYLNADVSLLGDMVVRFNVVRDSRLVFHDVEVEHPNPVFPGKFARIRRMRAWVPPLSIARIYPGSLLLQFNDMNLLMEQGDSGEWSHDGLMRPLAVGNSPFPFPFPKISDWRAEVRTGNLTLRRRGYEMKLGLDGEASARTGRKYFNIHADEMPFSFGRVDSQERLTGAFSPVNLRLAQPDDPGSLPMPTPGYCEGDARALPVAILPFLIDGIPVGDSPGTYTGKIRYDENPDAEATLFLDGELTNVALTAFGLPPRTPFRLTWPVGPRKDGLAAQVRMGPVGYGAFEMDVPLDAEGRPRLLSMRGGYAVLDEIPVFFTEYSRWPAWLSRMFPAIEWHTPQWRGFGWNGTNLQLSLSRATAGLNLRGEAEMMGGRVRVAMMPDQVEAPVTIAAERLKADQFVARLSRLLPETFRASLTGAHVNLTWRGFPSPQGKMEEWGTGMVWSKPVIDIAASGSWWQGMSEVTKAVARDLPDWGGGDASGLLALAARTSIPLDQVSLVCEREVNGELMVEFRAYEDNFGQVTGLIERRRDGVVEGEFLLAGTSEMLTEVAKVNTDFAVALGMLANDSPGLRVSFILNPGEEPVFSFPFLEDAKKLHAQMSGADGTRQ